MNPHASRNRRQSGITLLELMVVMVVMAVLAVMLFSAIRHPGVRSSKISCVNNLKQVTLATRLWAMDHGDKFPASVAMTNGGTMDHPLATEAWVHYQPLSNELNTPKILVCPTDSQMQETVDFSPGFGSNNVSYFVGLEAGETTPQLLLSGDRNLTANGVQLQPGVYSLNTNDLLGYAKSMHKLGGNIGLADGSVQQLSSVGLQNYVLANPQTNRLVIP